jgi:hypothetical protein
MSRVSMRYELCVPVDTPKVTLKSMALGVGQHVIPLGMIVNPQLIQLETDVLGALVTFAQMCLGLVHLLRHHRA